jgi:hypothetical protein
MKIDKLLKEASHEIKQKDKVKLMIRKTLMQLQKIINKRIDESNEITKSPNKSISLQDKRKLLKKLYAKTLTKMGQENNIAIFNDLIDQVPESYLDYELKIDLDKAGEVVDDLLKGEGQITREEAGNLANIVSGVGIPAIKEFAAGGKQMSKKEQDFGSDAINRNTKEYIKSKNDRNNPEFQLPAPESKELISTVRDVAKSENTTAMDIIRKLGGELSIDKNSKFGSIASKINPGKQTDLLKRLPKAIILNKSYEDAVKEDPVFLSMQPNEYYDLFKEIKKEAEKATVKK